MKIGYYPGCSLHSTGIEYDLSTRQVARALGIELEEIRNWVCCGSSPAHQSNEIMALALPAKNLSILRNENGLSEVCVPCASCFSRMKSAQAELKDADTRKKIEGVIDAAYPQDVKVMHALDAFLEKSGIEAIRTRATRNLGGMKVACYYGCLMTRPPKITDQAEYENPAGMDAIMEAIGAMPVDWNMKTYCCGASFALTETDVVLALTRKILGDATASGAEAVAVGCPLCHSNLDSRQAQINAKFGTAFNLPVFYFTELMGLAFGISAGDLGIPKHITDVQGFLKKRGLA